MFPFIPEGEHHVRNPCDPNVAPSCCAVRWFRACPACHTHTGHPGVVEAAADHPRTVRRRFRASCDGSLIMPISLYRRRIAATVIQLAKDDPSLVKEVIARLRESGEIEADDLVYLDRIADRWIKIAEENSKAVSAYPRQACG
uniref:Uncharacterized protein n=1 Tax=Dechloromonas aromatica (strain RCB) TaxID=159087 RepID=Q47CZ8_DECAR